MSSQPAVPVSIGPDEKTTPVMAYTTSAMIWGTVITKSVIRVSTWLRTNAAPDRFTLYNASLLPTTTTGNIKPIQFNELDLSVNSLIAFHMAPPGGDPIDYDTTEPNRKMEPVAAVLGTFLFRGYIRMSTTLDLKRHLEVVREPFTALYNVEISHTIIPNLGPICVPYALIRQEAGGFGKMN